MEIHISESWTGWQVGGDDQLIPRHIAGGRILLPSEDFPCLQISQWIISLALLDIWSCLTFGLAWHLILLYIWSCFTYGLTLLLVLLYIWSCFMYGHALHRSFFIFGIALHMLLLDIGSCLTFGLAWHLVWLYIWSFLTFGQSLYSKHSTRQQLNLQNWRRRKNHVPLFDRQLVKSYFKVELTENMFHPKLICNFIKCIFPATKRQGRR